MNYKLSLIVLGIIGICVAQSSENYNLKNSVFSMAGGRSLSDNYILNDAVGQPLPVGSIISDNYILSAGFFYNGETATDIDDEEPEIPEQFKLENNFPNPFNPTTTLRFHLPKREQVRIILYDLMGEKLKTITDCSYDAGIHEVLIDASQLSSGTYFYTIQAGDHVDNGKCLLIK